MKGPLHAIRRRRSERPANGVETEQAATEAPTEAQPTANLSSAPRTPAPDQAPPTSAQAAPTSEQAPPTSETAPPPAPADAPPAGTEVPAGQEPIPDRPSFRHRGRMRRRLRYLRRVRELGFRDLGGLVFDQHRFSQVNISLVEGKLQALAHVDAELRALEHALDDRRPLTELREPGISVCSRCGALHGSEARYCPSCGTPVHGPLAIAEVGEAVSLPVGGIGPITPPHPPGAPPPPAQPLAAAPLQSQPRVPQPAPTQRNLWAAAPPPAEQPATTDQRAAAEQAAAAEQPTAAEQPAAAGRLDAAEQPAAAGRLDAAEQPAAAEHPAPAEQPAAAEQSAAAEHVAPGEQPTEVMRPVDGEPSDSASHSASDGEAEAVAQPTGERRES
jgi:ribosomal protein L40E